MKPTSESLRLEWPDIAKGIAIIAVIAGHLGSDLLNRLVYLWHLPVFFIISGYFLRNKTDKELIKVKARSLLVPYYFTCLMICILDAIQSAVFHMSVLDSLAYWIRATIYAAGDSWSYPFQINGIGAIWFLWALFFAVLITNHFMGRKLGIQAVLAIGFIGWASFRYSQIWLPLSIQSGMLCSIYVLIGYKAKSILNAFSLKTNLIFLVITIIGIWKFKGFWLVHDFMGNGWLDFIISLCASSFIITLSVLISKRSKVLKKVLIFYGMNSLIIMCVHLVDLNVIHAERVIFAITKRLIPLLEINGYSADAWYMTVVILVWKTLFATVGAIVLGKVPFIRRIYNMK